MTSSEREERRSKDRRKRERLNHSLLWVCVGASITAVVVACVFAAVSLHNLDQIKLQQYTSCVNGSATRAELIGGAATLLDTPAAQRLQDRRLARIPIRNCRPVRHGDAPVALRRDLQLRFVRCYSTGVLKSDAEGIRVRQCLKLLGL